MWDRKLSKLANLEGRVVLEVHDGGPSLQGGKGDVSIRQWVHLWILWGAECPVLPHLHLRVPGELDVGRVLGLVGVSAGHRVVGPRDPTIIGFLVWMCTQVWPLTQIHSACLFPTQTQFFKLSDVFVWKITSFMRKTLKICQKSRKKLKTQGKKTQNSRWKLKKSCDPCVPEKRPKKPV